jgi:hypothetical protein
VKTMHDHHCIYQHGWATGEWCLDCYMDWSLFKGPRCRDEITRRGDYEEVIEALCDEPIQLGPDPEPGPRPQQLALPFEDPPADPEEMSAAYRRWVAGARFSLDDLRPSTN